MECTFCIYKKKSYNCYHKKPKEQKKHTKENLSFQFSTHSKISNFQKLDVFNAIHIVLVISLPIPK